MRAFTRIAIVNRGEAAMRLIRAAREVAVEQGSPLTTIAMYTEAERNSMFVREADEAVLIRSATQDPYLDYDVLERAIAQSAADAVWSAGGSCRKMQSSPTEWKRWAWSSLARAGR
jgi:acetyl/propionyl-CoA carboxylase alpha subunit